MRKVIVLWVSALLVLSAAVAFANGQKESTAMASSSGHKTLTVGFAQVGAESAWRTAETNSIKDTAKKEGINLKFVDAQQQQANQIAAIRSFIAEKVDGIILAPVVETGWDQVLGEAKAAGIPVILVDRGINADPSLYTTVIVGDYTYQGKACAEYLSKAMDHKGNIVELEGTPGSSPQIDRKKGFEEFIKQYPDMHIVYDQTGNFTRSGGLQVMEAAIKAVGASKINAVYAQNDDMALGAIQAMQEAGMQPGTTVKIAGIDAVHDALQAIINGTMNFTIQTDPIMGPPAFKAIREALAGKTLPKWIKANQPQFTVANAAAALPTRPY